MSEKLSKFLNYIEREKTFILILFLAVGLLFFRLDSRALWMDETMNLLYLEKGPGQFLVEYFETPDNHAPLYYLLVLLIYKIAPLGEIGIRLVSVLAGFFIVILVRKFSLLLFKDKRYANLSAFLTVLSSYFLLISQMARYHSLAALITLLSLYYFAKMILEGFQKKDFRWFVIWGLVLSWTDYPHFIYLLTVTNLFALYATIKKSFCVKLSTWVMSQLVIFVSFLPMAYLIFRRIVYQGDRVYEKTNLLGNSIFHWLASILMHFYAYFFGENILPWNYAFFAPGVIILLYLLWVLIKKIYKQEWDFNDKLALYLVLAFVVLNTIFLNLVNPRYNFIVYPKFVFVAFPLCIILITSLISAIERRVAKRAVIIAVIIISSYGLYNFYSSKNYLNPSYFNSMKSLDYVRDNSRAEDILILNGELNPGTYGFYKNDYFANIDRTINLFTTPEIGFQNKKRFWFFTTGSDDDNINRPTDSKIPYGLKIIRRFDSTPLDPMLKKLKEKSLGRESYAYKNSVFLLEN